MDETTPGQHVGQETGHDGHDSGPGPGSDSDSDTDTDTDTTFDPGDAPGPPETAGETPFAASSPPPPPPPPPGAAPGGPHEPPSPPGPPGPPPPGGWQTPPPPYSGGVRRSLRRSVHNRMLGGVAAGLADYLDIDPVIIRIAFVALSVLGGSGLLLYAAGWLLIPADDTGRAVVQDFIDKRPRRRSLITIVLGTVIGVIALSDLFSSGPWWPHWDGGFGGGGFFLGLCALALAVVLVITSGRGRGLPAAVVRAHHPRGHGGPRRRGRRHGLLGRGPERGAAARRCR